MPGIWTISARPLNEMGDVLEVTGTRTEDGQSDFTCVIAPVYQKDQDATKTANAPELTDRFLKAWAIEKEKRDQFAKQTAGFTDALSKALNTADAEIKL